jgi:hypothetical protein
LASGGGIATVFRRNIHADTVDQAAGKPK